MNIKRFIIASIAVFVVIQAIDWLVHGVLMTKWYAEITGLWRPDMMDLMWVMILGSLFFSFMFVLIFAKGYENKGITGGRPVRALCRPPCHGFRVARPVRDVPGAAWHGADLARLRDHRDDDRRGGSSGDIQKII